MALSAEAAQRFTDYVEHADMSDTAFGHDDALLAFAVWALVHEPTALQRKLRVRRSHDRARRQREQKAICTRGAGAAHPLIVAYERERSMA